MVKLKVLNKYTQVLWNVKIRTTNHVLKLLIEVKNVKKISIKQLQNGEFLPNLVKLGRTNSNKRV